MRGQAVRVLKMCALLHKFILVEVKSQYASEELKECPRLISSGSLSIIEEASPTFPNRSEAPVINNIDSAKEVLPEPPCPTIPILRIS